MKLSDAILKGCKKSARWKGEFYYRGSEGKIYACALGAAGIGVGIPIDTLADANTYAASHALAMEFPELHSYHAYARGMGDANLVKIIMRLNDELSWTRERIAKWLKKREL